MIPPRWISAGLLTFAALAAAAWVLQWQAGAVLREELGRCQDEQRELEAVRAEHARLQGVRVGETELQQLRSDHAALARLRGEVEALNTRVAERQRAAEQPVAAARAPVVNSPPALSLDIGLSADGTLSVDGSPAELAMVEQRLAGLMRGARVQVRLTGDPAQGETLSKTSRRLMSFAKDHALRMEVSYSLTSR